MPPCPQAEGRRANLQPARHYVMAGRNTKFHQRLITNKIGLVDFGDFPEKSGQVMSWWQKNSFQSGLSIRIDKSGLVVLSV